MRIMAVGCKPGRGQWARSQLTFENLDQPAYLVNSKFEIELANEAAETVIFGAGPGLSNTMAERNVFRLLFEG